MGSGWMRLRPPSSVPDNLCCSGDCQSPSSKIMVPPCTSGAGDVWPCFLQIRPGHLYTGCVPKMHSFTWKSGAVTCFLSSNLSSNGQHRLGLLSRVAFFSERHSGCGCVHAWLFFSPVVVSSFSLAISPLARLCGKSLQGPQLPPGIVSGSLRHTSLLGVQNHPKILCPALLRGNQPWASAPWLSTLPSFTVVWVSVQLGLHLPCVFSWNCVLLCAPPNHFAFRLGSSLALAVNISGL